MTSVASLRIVAVIIAVAAAIDPAVTVNGAARARVAVVAQPSTPNADAVAANVARDLGRDYDVVRDVVSDLAAAVVVGDRYPSEALPDSMIVATVTTSPDPSNGVQIVRVAAPREVPPATAIQVDADVAERGVARETTELDARIAGVEVGRVSHTWTSDVERWHATLDVVPVGVPPFVVRLEATTSSGARTAADLVVQMRTSPIRVEFFDPRPSWTSTFVRRALESDARFHVESLTFSSRGIAARTSGAVAITDTRLDELEAVVVGGLDRLTEADVHALDRYMRAREGAVVLLPDQRVDRGPVRELMPEATERLLERPARLRSAGAAATLQTSELLIARDLPPGSDVIAAVDDGGAVVASLPHGGGRLLVSGALDAWRFRSLDDAAFDRFWRSTIAGLALAAPPLVAVAVTPAVLRPDQPAEVVARVRSPQLATLKGSPYGPTVSATVDGQPLRLVPAAEPGVYHGRMVAAANVGRVVVEARASGGDSAGPQTGRCIVPIVSDARLADPEVAAPLSLVAASHGGIDVPADRLADVERFVHSAVVPLRTMTVRRPMRSAWWILPFAACLSADWWHRRRRGLS